MSIKTLEIQLKIAQNSLQAAQYTGNQPAIEYYTDAVERLTQLIEDLKGIN